MILVVDASVVIKWYTDELGSDQARAILAAGTILILPAHGVGEVGQVLVRRVRQKLISREQLDDAFRGLPRTVSLARVDELVSPAADVAVEAGVSFYDALYVAAAELWKARLVTSDERLVRLVRKSRWSQFVAALGDDISFGFSA